MCIRDSHHPIHHARPNGQACLLARCTPLRVARHVRSETRFITLAIYVSARSTSTLISALPRPCKETDGRGTSTVQRRDTYHYRREPSYVGCWKLTQTGMEDKPHLHCGEQGHGSLVSFRGGHCAKRRLVRRGVGLQSRLLHFFQQRHRLRQPPW